VDPALVVACISGAVAAASAALSAWTRLEVAKRESQGRAEERRSEAKVVLDRYRDPLLDAAWQLGNRIDNIRYREFFLYLSEGSGREQDVKLTTLFRFANYLGWRELVRAEVQLLRFDNEEDTRLTASILGSVTRILASDQRDHDGVWAMLWADEQRAIGELMIDEHSASARIRGHASFRRDYDDVFAPWMERFASDLFSPAAVDSKRLRFLQGALYQLVRQLDEEGTYEPPSTSTRRAQVGWLGRTALELEGSGEGH
jgi:hypothetical protein